MDWIYFVEETTIIIFYYFNHLTDQDQALRYLFDVKLLTISAVDKATLIVLNDIELNGKDTLKYTPADTNKNMNAQADTLTADAIINPRGRQMSLILVVFQ